VSFEAKIGLDTKKSRVWFSMLNTKRNAELDLRAN